MAALPPLIGVSMPRVMSPDVAPPSLPPSVIPPPPQAARRRASPAPAATAPIRREFLIMCVSALTAAAATFWLGSSQLLCDIALTVGSGPGVHQTLPERFHTVMSRPGPGGPRPHAPQSSKPVGKGSLGSSMYWAVPVIQA